MNEKIGCFANELNQIADVGIWKFATNAVNSLPDYFFTIPASTSGKYHPQYALGEGGLLRHTKAAVKIAIELFRIQDFSRIEQDTIITSLILHDGWKCGHGIPLHTIKEHPLYAVDKLTEIEKNHRLPRKIKKQIFGNIKSHMGQWTYGGITPEPKTKMEKFVHLVDYLASRKFIEIKLD